MALVLPPRMPPAGARCTPAGARCTGADGRPAVPWLHGCCSGGVKACVAAPDWGTWCRPKLAAARENATACSKRRPAARLKFVFTGVRQQGSVLQLSDLSLFDCDGARVAVSAAENPGGAWPGAHPPSKAVDGAVGVSTRSTAAPASAAARSLRKGTKWVDVNMGQRGHAILLVTLRTPAPLGAYQLSTANDSPAGDPVSWATLTASLLTQNRLGSVLQAGDPVSWAVYQDARPYQEITRTAQHFDFAGGRIRGVAAAQRARSDGGGGGGDGGGDGGGGGGGASSEAAASLGGGPVPGGSGAAAAGWELVHSVDAAAAPLARFAEYARVPFARSTLSRAALEALARVEREVADAASRRPSPASLTPEAWPEAPSAVLATAAAHATAASPIAGHAPGQAASPPPPAPPPPPPPPQLHLFGTVPPEVAPYVASALLLGGPALALCASAVLCLRALAPGPRARRRIMKRAEAEAASRAARRRCDARKGDEYAAAEEEEEEEESGSGSEGGEMAGRRRACPTVIRCPFQGTF